MMALLALALAFLLIHYSCSLWLISSSFSVSSPLERRNNGADLLYSGVDTDDALNKFQSRTSREKNDGQFHAGFSAEGDLSKAVPEGRKRRRRRNRERHYVKH